MSATDNSVSVESIGPYLEDQIVDFKGLSEVKKFSGGQSNPTYLLSADSGQYVLRRKPPGKLLKSAHAVDREYRVLNALAESDVPVARAYHLCQDDAVIGSMFYVMSFEDGRIFWDPALPEISQPQRHAYHAEMIRVLAAMHSVDVQAVGLGDYGRPGNYFSRQIDTWSKQYRASETHRIESMETLMSWLPENVPAEDGQVCLIHGDYRLDNMIFHPSKAAGIALLDWELSTLGHPMADLSYYCMCLRLDTFGDIKGLASVDRAQTGVPSEAEMIAQYCDLRGIEAISDWHFYLAFSYFRLAAIVQGVYKRALDGNASSEKALEVGKRAEDLSKAAVALI